VNLQAADEVPVRGRAIAMTDKRRMATGTRIERLLEEAMLIDA